MLKLFSWRRSALQLQFQPLRISISRFLTNSELYDDDDPPFTPTTATTTTTTTTTKQTPKKKKERKNETKNSDKNAEIVLPVKSELPFDFMYSYSETSSIVEPIGFREPKRFSPFGPGRIDRKWTGTCAPAQQKLDSENSAEERRRVLGDPLSDEEVAELVEKYRHSDCSRQINLGKGGVTHNTLEDIHNHWKKAEAIRIKCLGVPTLDMENICFHLECLCRTNLENRPVIPTMLWKPHAPIYPKLVKNVADGLTFEETKEMRNRGLNSPPLMKLSRNGVYVNVVEKVRGAFEIEEVVRLDCTHVGTNDCKKIAVKLRDLVPCVPILFKDEQIIIWKGNKESE